MKTGRYIPAITVALFLVIFVTSLSHAQDSAKVSSTSTVIHKGKTWAIAAPTDWRNKSSSLKPPIELYLTGDGCAGIPIVDGTISPLQIGMSVDVLPKGSGTPEELSAQYTRELKSSERFKLRREVVVDSIQLADGSTALLHSAEFDRIEKRRLSFYYKTISPRKDGHVVVATGWLACGRPGSLFAKKSGILNVLKACVTSLGAESNRVDASSVQKAHSSLNPKLPQAVSKVRTANKRIGQDDRQAIALYEEAIVLSDIVSAAHNGLAWVLITSEDNTLLDFEKGLKHAQKAVELTERMDVDSLDTLALAFYMVWKQEEAIRTIKEAIKLGVIYFAVNYNIQECKVGHMSVGKDSKCQVCGEKVINHFTRVVGFLTNVQNWHMVRREKDYPERQWYPRK